MLLRCPWTKDDPQMNLYHDTEWGVPLHDDQKLFEFMVLDAFQAGLSWQIVLRKRENFRKALAGFDAAKIARFDKRKIDALLTNEGIIRNKLKIEATIGNARAFLNIQEKYKSFDEFIWQFTGHKVLQNQWKAIGEIPARTEQSDAMSKELIRQGFRFVGSTICYAFMQAAGLVNDHLSSCFRYKELAKRK